MPQTNSALLDDLIGPGQHGGRHSEAQGKFYLQQDGKLMYRSSRTAGKAILTEDGGKTTITILPEDPTYRTGSARYERVK